MTTAAALLTASNTVPAESTSPATTCPSSTADCHADAGPRISPPAPATTLPTRKTAPARTPGRPATNTAPSGARPVMNAATHVSGRVPSSSTPHRPHEKQDSKAKQENLVPRPETSVR
jgi:hypothetical protein